LARSEANVIKELKRIIAYRPKYLHGYASSIYLLAQVAEKLGEGMTNMRVKAIVTESEKCHDYQKELIQRVFGAPVVENYGCVEFGMIAQPGNNGQLCINEDHVQVETTPGGDAVFTNLDEYVFPLIRFKNGDRITLGDVHDELPYRTINTIDGRITETIKLPQGGSLQGYVVMYPISKHSSLMSAYQIYQPDIGRLLIRIVPTVNPFPMEVRLQMEHEMRLIVGDLIFIDFEFLSAIPLTKRGKRLFICSDVREID
jgi:phenylacetate-CoA ligase